MTSPRIRAIRPGQRSGTHERDLSFEAPRLGDAIRALEAGQVPDETTLRAALRECRRIRAYIVRRGEPGGNADVLRWLDDHADVLRWALDQPRGLQERGSREHADRQLWADVRSDLDSIRDALDSLSRVVASRTEHLT